MLQAGITTRYLGPTNVKGSRIKALARTRQGGLKELSTAISLDHSLSIEGRHLKAAKVLAVKLGWDGLWIAGGTPDGNGYQFVNMGQRVWDIETLRPDETIGLEDTDWFYVPKA